MRFFRFLPALTLSFALCFGTTTAVANPEFWQHEWPKTNFQKTTIENWAEILSGGPPKDGIPAIDDPQFAKVAREIRIPDREPVITVEIGGQTRAYPIRYLIWHEIVNDTVAGVPVAITFCPLCNSGMVFDRRVQGKTLSFGVSGKLRHSDMVMYDRQTESWWQQAIGEGIVGHFSGTELEQLPAWMESWAEFKARNPDGLVMMQPRYARDYGRNPYGGYDSSRKPFRYNGENPPHGIPPLVRVVRVGNRAWPLTRLSRETAVHEAGLAISWSAGQASALDSGSIAKGKDVGTIRVRNTAGKDVPHDVMFAFAFHAFFPDGRWMLGN